MVVVNVPKTPKKAFDRNRRPSELLLKQIEHLEWAILPASQRNPKQLPKQKPKTEAQAAERVGQLTAMLLESKAKDRVRLPADTRTMPPVVLPPMPPVPAAPPSISKPPKRRSSTSRRGAKKTVSKRRVGRKRRRAGRARRSR